VDGRQAGHSRGNSGSGRSRCRRVDHPVMIGGHVAWLPNSGERFLLAIKDNLEGLQQAISGMATDGGEPAGVLKVSMGLNFGADHILPLLRAFLARFPGIRPDWQFTTRQIDLIAEGYDAAIGGGIEWGQASSRARLPRCT
jgi:DNA-binding transcriptional LysR family regulator